MTTKVLVVGPRGNPGMLGSYGRAFEKLGLSVDYFSLDAGVQRNSRFGALGKRLSAAMPVEVWVRKGNRELHIHILDTNPDLVLLGGATPIRAGTLAQIKVSRPKTKIAHAWPDSLLGLPDSIAMSLAMCDYVACYSSQAVDLLAKMSRTKVEWVPFGVDSDLFPDEVTITDADRARFECDVSFVGNHRPEREEAVLRLLDAGISVKVWADAWTRPAKNKERARSYFQNSSLVGRDVVKAMRCSKLALNVIDRTNYPAANMRFFEIYACGGTPLSSRCPEMENEFVDGETAAYFEADQIVERAKLLLADPTARQSIRERGRALALAKHTYQERARQILSGLQLV